MNQIILSMLSIQKKAISYCVMDNTGGLKRVGSLLPITDILIGMNGEYLGIIARKRDLKRTRILIKPENIVSYTDKTVVAIGYLILNNQSLKNIDCLISSKLINTPIKLEDGNLVGFISDVYINIETSNAVAIEVSKSLFEDMLNGRKLIPSFVKMDSKYNFSVITNEQIECSFNNDKGIVNKVKRYED